MLKQRLVAPQSAQGRTVKCVAATVFVRMTQSLVCHEVAVRCCCFEQGLEKTEQIMGWSARSGKIVLRIALQRLKRYYDKLHGAGGGTIG